VSEPSELERVLGKLDKIATYKIGINAPTQAWPEVADAARLLRAMAADFARFAEHDFDERGAICPRGTLEATAAGMGRVCSCGLDAARERWRLNP
jgi:hypothetical protein